MLVFGVTIKYICNKGNFAFVKYYHQKKRNRLTEQNTDALMRICLEQRVMQWKFRETCKQLQKIKKKKITKLELCAMKICYFYSKSIKRLYISCINCILNSIRFKNNITTFSQNGENVDDFSQM